MTSGTNAPIAAADAVDNLQACELSYGARRRARFDALYVSGHFSLMRPGLKCPRGRR